MIQRVGVIGMGTMGAPMALNLLKAGFAVTVYNRDVAKTRRSADAGATVASSIAQLATACDVILLMLADDAAVREVVLGEGGVAAHAKAGSLVIDSSTVHPKLSVELSGVLAKKGVDFLDAPVTGSKPQAEGAKLFFLVGGNREAYERAVPLFEAMGRRHVHLGDNGAAACVKLCNNLATLINLAAFCEAMALGKAYGVDLAKVYEVISDSGGRSAVSEGKGPKILREDFSPDFALRLAGKDIGLAKKLAGELGAAAPLAESTMKIYETAKQAGEGDADACALFRWYARKP